MNIMKNKLWRFIDNTGTFQSDSAHTIKSLYFPLCNNTLMSSVSPDLKGSCAKDHNHFLLEPVSRISVLTSRASRNFWVYINQNNVWSATGVSKSSTSKELVSVEAGGSQKIVDIDYLRSIGFKEKLLTKSIKCVQQFYLDELGL